MTESDHEEILRNWLKLTQDIKIKNSMTKLKKTSKF